MKKLFALLFLLAGISHAQTTVTATVIDPNGNPYANGTVSAYTLVATGQPFTSITPVATTNLGSFSLSLPANTYIFTVCAQPVLQGQQSPNPPPTPPNGIPSTNPAPKQICFASGPIAISGGVQDISAQLNAVAALLGPRLGSGGGGGDVDQPGLQRTNSPNGTTQGSLVTYDCTHIDTVNFPGFCEVQTTTAGAKNAIGVCIAGCGTSGVATIGTTLSAPCTLDGPGTPGNAVSVSASVNGFCSDENSTVAQPNVQTVGRIAKANTGGAGTQAQVDFFLGDLFSPGSSSSGNAFITPCTTNGCNIYEPTANTATITGDNSFTDNGSGTFTAVGGIFTGAGAGFIACVQGTAPSLSLSNAVYQYCPTSIPTSWGWVWASSVPTTGCATWTTSGQLTTLSSTGVACGASTITLQTNGTNNSSQSTLNLVNGSNITITNTSGGNVSIAASAASITLQTNGVNNSSQTTLNNESGTGVTVSNVSGGNVQYSLTGSGQLGTPTTPTVTPQGTTGSSTCSYMVIGVQDGIGAVHFTPSTVGTTSTCNATLSSSNNNLLSGYGDTFYGVRGFIICRTAGGASQGVITGTAVAPTLAGKKFVDTGLAADGTNCATKYATNTTKTTDACFGAALPGSPTTPGFPCGTDGPPLTPTATDDECMQSFGAPGDVNDPFWTIVNHTSETWAFTSGMCTLTLDAGNGANPSLRFLEQTAPSTPFTYVAQLDPMLVINYNNCGIAFRESSTGKVFGLELQQRQALSGSANGGMEFSTFNWTSSTSANEHATFQYDAFSSVYLKLQDTGTNIVASWSLDGVAYQTFDTQAVTSAFTTAPNQVGLEGSAYSTTGGSVCAWDYWRRTQ